MVKFVRTFFYTFLDNSGILLGVFLIALGGWIVHGRTISEGWETVVLILGILSSIQAHTLDLRFRNIFS